MTAQLSMLADEPAPAPRNDGIERDALLSADGRYRFTLRRTWNRPEDRKPRRVLFVAANPSTADHTVDDPTVKRWIGFAKGWGYDEFLVVNLCAWRATKPADLIAKAREGVDVVGPNQTTILAQLAAADLIVACWGEAIDTGPRAPEQLRGRDRVVLEILRSRDDVYCFGKTKSGAPKHPLYLDGDTALELYAEGPSKEPIPLAAPDGRIFAYACRYCLQIPNSGTHMVRHEPSAEDIAGRRADAFRCCHSRECGALEIGAVLRCSACQKKQDEIDRPAMEAAAMARDEEVQTFAGKLRAALLQWDAEDEKPWPCTITHGRDGLDFVAFPFDLEDVPTEVSERAEAAFWWIANEGAPFGQGPTPEAALASLRDHARRVKAEAQAKAANPVEG